METLNKEKRYTYEEYYAWEDDGRWELYGGVPHALPRGELLVHQTVFEE